MWRYVLAVTALPLAASYVADRPGTVGLLFQIYNNLLDLIGRLAS